MARPRVLFIHGQEGSPQGSKARALAAAFETTTPAMDTSNFEACVAQQAEAIRRFRAGRGGRLVVRRRDRGGAAAARSLERADAAARTGRAATQGVRGRVPSGERVWLVHARGDDVVPIADSRRLARSGTPGCVRLIEVDDDHALHDFVTSGGLVETRRRTLGRRATIRRTPARRRAASSASSRRSSRSRRCGRCCSCWSRTRC